MTMIFIHIITCLLVVSMCFVVFDYHKIYTNIPVVQPAP